MISRIGPLKTRSTLNFDMIDVFVLVIGACTAALFEARMKYEVDKETGGRTQHDEQVAESV